MADSLTPQIRWDERERDAEWFLALSAEDAAQLLCVGIALRYITDDGLLLIASEWAGPVVNDEWLKRPSMMRARALQLEIVLAECRRRGLNVDQVN